MARRKQKQIERICANCKLFNPQKSECSVVILMEGNRVRIPVDAEDPCFYEGMYFDPTTKAMEDFAGEIQQVRFWTENRDGEKTSGDGIVKMEYPEGFFGAGMDELIQLDLPEDTE